MPKKTMIAVYKTSAKAMYSARCEPFKKEMNNDKIIWMLSISIQEIVGG